jgi:hypothetical protein
MAFIISPVFSEKAQQLGSPSRKAIRNLCWNAYLDFSSIIWRTPKLHLAMHGRCPLPDSYQPPATVSLALAEDSR